MPAGGEGVRSGGGSFKECVGAGGLGSCVGQEAVEFWEVGCEVAGGLQGVWTAVKP